MLIKTLSFYFHPLMSLQGLKEGGWINWKFPLLVYCWALIITLLISVIVKILTPDEMGLFSYLLHFPIFTLPGIAFYTITGALFIKETGKILVNRLSYAILTMSFGFVCAYLTILIVNGFIHNKTISDAFAVASYFGFLLISRFVINMKLFRSHKNIVLKSILEAVLVFILLFLGVGLLLLAV